MYYFKLGVMRCREGVGNGITPNMKETFYRTYNACKKNIIEISCIFFNSKIVHISTDVKHYSSENKHRLAAAATCVRRGG